MQSMQGEHKGQASTQLREVRCEKSATSLHLHSVNPKPDALELGGTVSKSLFPIQILVTVMNMNTLPSIIATDNPEWVELLAKTKLEREKKKSNKKKSIPASFPIRRSSRIN